MEANNNSIPFRNQTPAPRPVNQMIIGCAVIPLLLIIGAVAVYGFFRANAAGRLTVPQGQVILVRAKPDNSAPLLARMGENNQLRITGRTADWRWLEVEIWDDQTGWTLRPLDILVWRLQAPETAPASVAVSPDAPETIGASEMIAIPETTFTMGSPAGLGEADEQPAHPVTVSAFDIDKTEVTVGQYWQCVQAGACAAPQTNTGQLTANYLNNPAFDDHPVINVPWTEANHYCLWQGKRLPTEAEWELTAGWNEEKGAKLRWPWGNSSAGIAANVGETSPGVPKAVGTHPADVSSLGALDMGGNVSEWVFDWYKVDYYSVADDTDPVGPTHRRGEGTGRGVRGGSYADTAEQARTANRHHKEADYGYASVGFRCARDR
jgi:formylglycine-generating enzyme required for sulfatase activity